MNCASCGHDNPERAKFCLECGTPIAARCAACGTELPPAAKFCLECGARTGAAPATPSPPAAARDAGSRKVVTILFADLAGSTALQERLDAESTSLFMERYYAAMRAAVLAHGGTVVKLLGDGVMVAFGVPRVAEDDALRAVRAGVAMQQAFRALAGDALATGAGIGLRIAVNTGEVVVNADHSDVVGDPVNVAARLQQEAGDNEVVLGEATQRLVASLVTLEPIGSVALKGRSEAVKAYRVVSLERPQGAAAAAFVGRNEELARLTAVYDRAVGTPASALVVLLGSPGLGKSRLIDEFARRQDAAATIITAHCDAAGGATFAPLVQALRALLAIDDGADAAALRTAIEAALPGDDGERGRIAGGIAALLTGSPASPEETFFVVRRFLAGVAQARPVLLVIDDLHWAEPLLLDLVEHLVQWGAGVPLLVLVGARPELRAVRSSLVTPGGLVADVVTLAGLDAGAAMRLAANVIGAADLPAAVAAKVLATSEGNPLFVGELVRMLVQEGALTKEGERWTIGAGLAALEMPPTIHALLAARIERLRPDERSVLERAAVVGRHFSRSAVAALLPSEAGELDARLESLKRGELIEPDSGWFLGEPVLRFHHVLIRDAAYRRLLKGTRAELHARLADWIEAQVGDAAEHDESIGRHLEQAHQHLRELGPLDAQGRRLGERASQRLAAAGRRALAGDDLPLAAGLLGRAIAGLDDADPTRAELALDWCEALLAAGDVGPAAQAIDELVTRENDARRQRLTAWRTCFTGQLTVLTAPEALQATADAVAAAASEFAALGDAAGEAKAHQVHAQALARLGRVGACEAALDRALAAARKAGDRRRANAVLAGAPLAALWGPSPVTRASGRCLDVVRVLRITQGAPAVEAVALSCQGVLEALRGRTDAARRMIASSRQMVEELGITHRLFEADAFVGRIELLEGDATAAERSLRRAYEGLRDLGLGVDAAQAAALLARALLAQQRGGEAEALSRESEALAGDDLQAAIAWRGVRAEALAQRGEHAAAVELAQAAVAIAAATDALLDHADARLALAAALRAAGRSAEAETEKRRAGELWETKGATLLAERVRRAEARAEAIPHHTAVRSTPPHAVQRRLRPNAVTTAAAQFDAAFASGAIGAIEASFVHAAGVRVVDHPTESTYGRQGAIDSYRRLLRLKDPVVRHEPLATLGDSVGLFRRRISAGGTTGGRFDVADYQREELVVSEPGVLIEIFAADRLGEAVIRLFEHYVTLLPEGPARSRAATAARSIAAFAQGDPDCVATALAPTFECVDHRNLRPWHARSREEFLTHLRLQGDFATGLVPRLDDVLALSADAVLGRLAFVGSGDGRGAFENAMLCLTTFGADGVQTAELWDADRDAEALARFDELTRGPAAQPARRRVRANAASENGARIAAALAERDLDTAARRLADSVEIVHHPTGSTYGRAEVIQTFRLLVQAEGVAVREETLATLGDALALSRQLLSVTSSEDHIVGTIGAAEHEIVILEEVDGNERRSRAEIFAADHLGDAIVRLYERYAELLPAGAARHRAATAAYSLTAFAQQADPERIATAIASPFECVDHRSLHPWSTRSAEEFVTHFRLQSDLATSFVGRYDDVLALTADGALFRQTYVGTARDGGGAFENAFVGLTIFGADGRGTRVELWEPDGEAEALARFEALTTGAMPTRPAPRVRANAASLLAGRFQEAFAAGDDAALGELFASELEVVDHPNGAGYGRDGHLGSLRGLRRAHDPVLRFEPIATLGEALFLSRRRIRAGGMDSDRFDVGAYEREEIVLFEVGEGRCRHLEVFAANHLGDAIARLYERHAELLPDGPERAATATTARAFAALRLPIDLERMATILADAAACVDHRIVGTWNAQGAKETLEHYRLQEKLTTEFVSRDDEVLALEPRAVLLRRTYCGTLRATSGPFENPLILLLLFGADGLHTWAEVWEPEREAEALARFDELVGRRPSAKPNRLAVNAATSFRERIDAAWRARDWAGLAALLGSDYHFSDRRRLVQVEMDRDGWVEMARQLGAMGSARVTTEELATRGNRLALWRVRIDVADGDVGPSHVEHLNVHEVTGDGDRLIAGVRFDADDLDGAYAELDARYEAGEGATYPAHAVIMRAFTAAVASRDWDPVVALCAPTFVEHDHRALAVLGTTRGGAAWTENFRTLTELAPDTLYRADHFRSAARGFCSVGTWHGTRDGGRYEIALIAVIELDAGGRMVRADIYDEAQSALALARFAELEADTAAPPRFANAATATVNPVVACIVAQDWQEFARLFAPDFHMSDRRRGVRLELDRDRYVAFTREVADGRATRNRWELAATRGDRLAVIRAFYEFADADVGPSEIAFLLLVEADARSRIVANVRWDLDALDPAYTELDARWGAGEGAAHPPAAHFVAGYQRCFAARDWTGLTALFAPELVAESHRLAGWGTLHGPATLVSTMQTQIELAPDTRMRMDHVRTCAGGALFEYAWGGTRDGGAFENLYIVAAEVDALGRARRVDVWEAEQLEQAQARFAAEVDRRGTRDGGPDPLAAIANGNAATAAMDRWRLTDAGSDVDWDALRASCAPGLLFEDRQGFARLTGDSEMMIASLRERVASGNQIERVLLGIAGERIAVVRMLWSGGPSDGRFEIEYLAMSEIDEAGLLTATILFAPDDARAAQREAWARWAAIDPTSAPLTALYGAVLDAANARDAARYRTLFADALVIEDHRHGLRIEGLAAYAEQVALLWQHAPDSRLDGGWFWPAIAPHGAVTVTRRSGALADELLWLFTVERGRIARIEVFALDAVDEAVARLAELRPDRLRIPPNAASLAQDRHLALAAAGEWDAVQALHAPSLVFDDRRQGLRTTTDGAAYLAGMRWGVRDPRVQMTRTLLATAGERLELRRNRFTRTEDGVLLFEVDTLAVTEVDAEGRLLAIVLFDPADRIAASTELFERYAASGADGVSPRAFDVTRAWNDHDLERLRALLPDDFYLDDRRRTGVGRIDGADAYVASLAAMHELSRDLRIDVLYYVTIADHGGVYVARWSGTNLEGGEFEAVYVCLGLAEGEKFVGLELFELEDFDAALARFEALRPEPPHSST